MPQGGHARKPVLAYSASMGIYIYEPEALEALPPGPCQFPDLVLRLLERGERIAAFQSPSAWYHIGTFEQHEEVTRLLGDEPPDKLTKSIELGKSIDLVPDSQSD